MLLPSLTPDPRRGDRSRARRPPSPPSPSPGGSALLSGLLGTRKAPTDAPSGTLVPRHGQTLLDAAIERERAKPAPPPSPNEARIAALHGRLDRVEAALRQGGLTPKTTVGLQQEMRSIAADLHERHTLSRLGAGVKRWMDDPSWRSLPNVGPEGPDPFLKAGLPFTRAAYQYALDHGQGSVETVLGPKVKGIDIGPAMSAVAKHGLGPRDRDGRPVAPRMSMTTEQAEAQEIAGLSPLPHIRDNPHRGESVGKTLGRVVETARQAPALLGRAADAGMRKAGLDPNDHPYLADAVHFGTGALGDPVGFAGSVGKGLEDPAGAWRHAPEGLADLIDSVNPLGPVLYPSLYTMEERSGPAQLNRLLNLGATGVAGAHGLDTWRGSAMKAGVDNFLTNRQDGRTGSAAPSRPGFSKPSSAAPRDVASSEIRTVHSSEQKPAVDRASSPSVLEKATKAALNVGYEAARPQLERAAKGLDLSGSRQEQALALRDAVDPSIRTHVAPFLKERWDREFAEQKAQTPKPKKKRILRGQEPWAADASASGFARRSRTVGADGTMLEEIYGLGHVSKDLAERIESKLGVQGMEGAIVTLRSHEVRHAFKGHATKADGAYAITHEDFDDLHAMMHDPAAEIELSPDGDGNGNKVIVFRGRDARGQMYTNTAVLYPGRARTKARLDIRTVGRKGLGQR